MKTNHGAHKLTINPAAGAGAGARAKTGKAKTALQQQK